MSQSKALIKKIDDLFSQCVRLRDMYGRCITCEKPFKGNYALVTCGHFQKRRHIRTRWSFENAYGQCWQCNGKDDQELYTQKMVEFIGQEKVDMIIQMAREEIHLSYMDLKEIHKSLLEYKQKIKS